MMRAFMANLHLRRKSTMACIAAFTATFLLISLVVSTAVGADMSQLNALLRSEYEYSATAQNSTLENTYYQYNAGISFTIAESSQSRLNAEVLMQTEEGYYSNAVYWNTTALSSNGIAVSENIADSHELSVGDVIYSKHIVDGTTRAYIIEKILPAVTSVRVAESGKHSDGIIVMGYDEQYAMNISYNCIIFTNDPIELLAEGCSEMPTAILYRDDEIATVAMRILPYMLVYVFMAMVLVAITVIFISKSVAGNFKRLAASGAEFGAVNRAYYKATIGVGMGVTLVSVPISAFSFGIAGFYPINAVPVMIIAVAEIITLIAMATVSNKRLWRK